MSMLLRGRRGLSVIYILLLGRIGTSGGGTESCEDSGEGL